MTAPLPPLPKFLVALLPHEERAMQSYAKLAVREALERAEQKCIFNTDYVSANAIRTMIEEYK